jgi:hypothetical protein
MFNIPVLKYSLILEIKDYKDAEIQRVGEEDLVIEAGSRLDGVFFIEMEKKDLKAMKTILEVQLIRDGEVVEEIGANFIGPVTKMKK